MKFGPSVQERRSIGCGLGPSVQERRSNCEYIDMCRPKETETEILSVPTSSCHVYTSSVLFHPVLSCVLPTGTPGPRGARPVPSLSCPVLCPVLSCPVLSTGPPWSLGRPLVCLWRALVW